MFPSFMVQHIIWDSSDHSPILVHASKNVRKADKGLSWEVVTVAAFSIQD